MIYNISGGRTIELILCEFFENNDYRNIITVGWVQDGLNRYLTGALLSQTDINYDTVKAMAECEFQPMNNVVKANACEVVQEYLVEQFDNDNLFDNAIS